MTTGTRASFARFCRSPPPGSPAPALPTSEGTPSHGPRACVLDSCAPAGSAYQRAFDELSDVLARPMRADERALRAPRAPPRGTGRRTWRAGSRGAGRSAARTPRRRSTGHPHQAAGLTGRDDHGDRRNDVERGEREVAGAGDPSGADRSGEATGMVRPSSTAMTGANAKRYRPITRAPTCNNIPNPGPSSAPKKLDTAGFPTPMMQMANVTGSTRSPRRRHARATPFSSASTTAAVRSARATARATRKR